MIVIYTAAVKRGSTRQDIDLGAMKLHLEEGWFILKYSDILCSLLRSIRSGKSRPIGRFTLLKNNNNHTIIEGRNQYGSKTEYGFRDYRGGGRSSGRETIGAVKGFEMGDDFAAARMKGSENNDAFTSAGKATNHAGGVLGGLTDGSDLIFRVAVKPTPSIAKSQKTIDNQGKETELVIHGRHDPVIVPRADELVHHFR